MTIKFLIRIDFALAYLNELIYVYFYTYSFLNNYTFFILSNLQSGGFIYNAPIVHLFRFCKNTFFNGRMLLRADCNYVYIYCNIIIPTCKGASTCCSGIKNKN